MTGEAHKGKSEDTKRIKREGYQKAKVTEFPTVNCQQYQMQDKLR